MTANPADAVREAPMTDTFNGDNAHLIECIAALLSLDSAGALVPHGIGGHARKLLESAASRLATLAGAAPVAWSQIEDGKVVALAFTRSEATGCTSPLYHAPAKAREDGLTDHAWKALCRCIGELRGLTEQASDLDLDEITVQALQTGIDAMQEKLDRTLPIPGCPHPRAQVSIGPTTNQRNHHCPDCNAWWTTFPEGKA